VLTTTSTCLAFELTCAWLFQKKLIFPLSIFITSLSLSFLLDYKTGSAFLFLPVFYAVAMKYLLTYNGKHFFNPAGTAVTLSVMTSAKLITLAPASQWNGFGPMPFLVLAFGALLVLPKVNRTWLVGSYFLSFLLFALVRAKLNAAFIDPEVLIWGTISSVSFLIFIFFMITDPATSPANPREQLLYGLALGAIDFLLHLRHNYYTFFLSLFIITGALGYFQKRFLSSKHFFRPLVLGPLLALLLLGLNAQRTQSLRPIHPGWRLELIPSAASGLSGNHDGGVDKLLAPGLQHVAKILFSIGDGVAIGDVDGDGLQDVFLTNFLKAADERCALFKNLGNHKFQRIEIPALRAICDHPEINGIVTQGIFVDYDNSARQSLFLTTASGHPHLLKNTSRPGEKISFVDVTNQSGLSEVFTNSVGATIADFNKDGLLDVLIANSLPEFLSGYSIPHRLNVFHLPKPEYPGDLRMFAFGPSPAFHEANNGGEKILLLQTPDHGFVRQDAKTWGIAEHHWSYGVGVADLNQDGWPDIYGIRDFGPDDVYLNEQGKKFINLTESGLASKRKVLNSGMNQSLADFDRTGWLGVYVSNVFQPFEAVGSALWLFQKRADSQNLVATERSQEKGLVNENRIGMGAVAVDLNNEGWVGIAQANGGWDNAWENSGKCVDYLYYLEKLTRAPASYLANYHNFPDARGACLYPKEKNRIYLNRGTGSSPQFLDIAETVGVTEEGNAQTVASADFENSGRRDLLFTHLRAEPSLYKNVAEAGAKNDWIGFELESRNPRCNREAIGTKITLNVQKTEEPGFTLLQEKQMISGLIAQSDKRLHFGLGKGAANISAVIDWCGGLKVERFAGLKLNEYHKIILE
jgi:enediyne biosynthesis protein E4